MKNKNKASSQTAKGSGELMTCDEVIEILRLNARGLKSPKEVLRHLRRTRQIAYLKLGGRILFRRSDIEEYINRNVVKALK